MLKRLRQRIARWLIGDPPPVRLAALGTIELEDGDVLLVKTQEPITQEAAEYIKAKLADTLPDTKIVVFCGDLDLSVIRQKQP